MTITHLSVQDYCRRDLALVYPNIVLLYINGAVLFLAIDHAGTHLRCNLG